MPTEKLSMRKIFDILRMHFQEGFSNRAIARSLGISAGTVSVYITRSKAANIGWPIPEGMDEDRLYQLLFPKEVKGIKQRPLPDLLRIHKELKRKGVTLMLLWYEYRSQNPNGYGYSRFCELYNDFTRTLNPVMRLSHRAGEKMFVDYSGLTVDWIDKDSGEAHKAEVFVAVLGASSYTYIEVSESQSSRHWIDAHIRAFEFFGGCPQCVVPDNLKSAVTKSHLYEPDTNRSYQDMANYYETAVIPARVRAPKDKAKVEVGVQGIQRWILAPLRDRTFFSIHEINEAIYPLLDAYNERPFQELEGSRQSQYIDLDKPALRALPIKRYEFVIWKNAKAGIDYHVTVDKHHYSIPYQYLNNTIEVRLSDHTVECFLKGKRIAIHQRSYKPGYTTVHEHMPKAHQDYAQWTPERLHRWASRIGANTAELVNEILSSYKVPQQGFRSCLGILRMSKQYGDDRLENAAIRALQIGAFNYKSMESILKNGLDKQPLTMPASKPTTARNRHHENVRGAEYYH